MVLEGRGGVGVALVLAVACADAPARDAPPAAAPPLSAVRLEKVVEGLARPVGLVAAGDRAGRLFVVGQRGVILVFADGALANQPFLDISERVSCCGERGLLGLAFHPRYRENGLFFVNYTDRQGDTVVSRFRVSADPGRAEAASEEIVLAFDQPFPNHNGGQLAFGPDGYLYVATGDGGAGGDPLNNGQSLSTLLGKLLRLDVDETPYGVPSDNPFTGDAAARAEIWAYGLRNPWRFSFDRSTGDLWIADVGQNRWEEIDFQPAASRGGENYGWRVREGRHCFEPRLGCEDEGLTEPVLEYDHQEGCSVTGGFRYRGSAVPALAGAYLYGDYCTGTVWAGTPDADGEWSSRVLLRTRLAISSFGEDEAGEVFVVALGERNGSLHRFVAGD